MAIEGRMLKPANENPWYVLMTLYGEQDGKDDSKINHDLHSKNREAWNLLACRALSVRKLDELIAAKVDLPSQGDWDAREQEITSLFKSEMRRRNPDIGSLPTFPDAYSYLGLDNCQFDRKLVASGYLFPLSVAFSNSNFNKSVDFRDARFFDIAEFDDAAFMNVVWFSNVFFGHAINFISTAFNRGAQFDSASFNGIACRKGQKSGQATSFGGSTSFRNAKFRNFAEFKEVEFSEKADVTFSSAAFESGAEFDGTTFFGPSDFSKSMFEHDASFNFVNFHEETKFNSVNFNQVASFKETRFCHSTRFVETTFKGFARFPEAWFGVPNEKHELEFIDCQFHKPTSFRQARFLSQYPDFAGTMLHDKTTFTAKAENWPNSEQVDDDQAKTSCATIKHNLGKQGLPEDEHFFFRREMEFAGQSGPWWQRPLGVRVVVRLWLQHLYTFPVAVLVDRWWGVGTGLGRTGWRTNPRSFAGTWAVFLKHV